MSDDVGVERTLAKLAVGATIQVVQFSAGGVSLHIANAKSGGPVRLEVFKALRDGGLIAQRGPATTPARIVGLVSYWAITDAGRRRLERAQP